MKLIVGARIFEHVKKWVLKRKVMSNQEKTRNINFLVLYYLNRACRFHFKCVSIKRPFNEALGPEWN